MIFKSHKEEFASYLEDTSNLKGDASLLYIPQSKRELIDLIVELNAKKMPVTISAGRTGTTAGCVPSKGVIISLEGINRIIGVDEKTKTIKVESGLALESLIKEASRFGLGLKASPTEPLAFVGGVISTSASGVRGFGYGSIRNYVNEIEVILTTGDTLRITRGKIFSKQRVFDFEYNGRKYKFSLPSYKLPAVKSQAGYFVKENMDLIDLFIGAEGTLGIIVEATLKLERLPDYIFDGLVFFDNEEEAFSFIEKIKKLKKENWFNPASLEFLDKNSLELLKKEFNFIKDSFDACIYFEQEVENLNEKEIIFNKWVSLIENSGALIDDCIIADSGAERQKIFDFRHKLPQTINEYLRQHSQTKTATDIAVPDEKFLEMYEFYKEVGNASGINYVNFGHIGENHMHFNFLPRNDIEKEKSGQCLVSLCKKGISLGGTVSAEHGIGKIKKPYLKIMYSEKEIKEMAGLKKYFDPSCILNLDNIFDRELLF